MPNATVRANAQATPIDRRLFLAAGSAAAVFAALRIAPAAEADPVLAAIECHKIAADRHEAACGLTDEVAAEQAGREITIANEAEYSAATDAEAAALFAMLSAPPRTAAGARAQIEYVLSFGFGLTEEALLTFLEALLRSQLMAAAAEGV
jgi:hypothetical protein